LKRQFLYKEELACLGLGIALLAGAQTANAAGPDPFAPNAPSPTAPTAISPEELRVLQAPPPKPVAQPAPIAKPEIVPDLPPQTIVEPIELPSPKPVKTAVPSPVVAPSEPESPSFFDSLKNFATPDETEPQSAPEPALVEKPALEPQPVVETIEIPEHAPVVMDKPAPTPEKLAKPSQPEEPGWLDRLANIFSSDEPTELEEAKPVATKAEPIAAPEPIVQAPEKPAPLPDGITLAEPTATPTDAAPKVIAPDVPEVTEITLAEPTAAPIDAAPKVVAPDVPEVTEITLAEPTAAPIDAAPKVVAPDVPEVTETSPIEPLPPQDNATLAEPKLTATQKTEPAATTDKNPGYLQLERMDSPKQEPGFFDSLANMFSSDEPRDSPKTEQPEPKSPVELAHEALETKPQVIDETAFNKPEPVVPAQQAATTDVTPNVPDTFASKSFSQEKPAPLPDGISPVDPAAEATVASPKAQETFRTVNEPASTQHAKKEPEEPGFFDRLKNLFGRGKDKQREIAVEAPEKTEAPVQQAAIAPKTALAPKPGMVFDTAAWGMGSNLKLGQTLSPMERQDLPCFQKMAMTRTHCVRKVKWPSHLSRSFDGGTILYNGSKAIVGYDQGRATRIYSLFTSDSFDAVVGHYQKMLGAPLQTAVRKLRVLKGPALENNFVLWQMGKSSSNDGPVTVEIRRFDDIRQTFPDTENGVIRIYFDQTSPIFSRISPLDFMALR